MDETELGDLICTICLDVANFKTAVESTCCHKIFCQGCIGGISSCPNCRQEDWETVDAVLARRILSNIKVSCPNTGCQLKIPRSNLSDHRTKYCEFRDIICPDPNCKDLKFPRDEFVQHLVRNHMELLLENHKRLWTKKQTVFLPQDNLRTENQNVQAASNIIVEEDMLAATNNKFGRLARLGTSGKFYCGGQLDGAACLCCDGRCGPTNGCNCSACMILDVTKRKLPFGSLVNKEGSMSRRSSGNNSKFYCGRRSIKSDNPNKFYCEVSNKQCQACKLLDQQFSSRYSAVWQT